MTVEDSAAGAVLPWNSLDAGVPLIERLPQQDIDVCLFCPYAASDCDRCDGKRNLERKRRVGRPSKQIDPDRLREMLKLKMCNRELCKAFGVSAPTLIKEKNKILKEVSA